MQRPAYRFTVYGNEESRLGNPRGYVRTTQRGKWVSLAFRRYQQYQGVIVAALLDAYPDPGLRRNCVVSGKPIVVSKSEKYRLRLRVFYANDRRPDPSQVLKAVEDAVFAPDKNVESCVAYDFDPVAPRVEVAITRLQ